MRTTSAIVVSFLFALGCDSADRSFFAAPPAGISITGVHSLPAVPLGAVIDHDYAGDDSIRVVYKSTDGSESGSTPWESSAAPLLLLGLKPAETYSLSVQSHRELPNEMGPPAEYTSPALPTALSGLRISLSGPASGGYSVAPLAGADGHGYLVIFDSLGTIRWYRDFGTNQLFASAQQPNGHFTAFVGASTGSNRESGTYVEVTPAGDSVRSIVADGSPYTDPHELVETVDRSLQSEAYLFGYDFKAFDRTAVGGGPDDKLAVHQILAVNDAGKVDTVFIDDDEWGVEDEIEPPEILDLDHPNSLDFDQDGGLIVSFRDLNAIVKIDLHTREIVWQLGGTHNQFTILNDPFGEFDGQHTVRVLPNGHLLVFDNGWNHSPQQSRGVEYALDLSRMTATMVWQYSANPPIFNDFTGSAQRLSNGNTIVAFTRKGIVDEVRPDGTLLSRCTLEYQPGVPATPYRVVRINNLYNYVRP